MTGNVFGEITRLITVLRTSYGVEYGNYYNLDIVKRTYEGWEYFGNWAQYKFLWIICVDMVKYGNL